MEVRLIAIWTEVLSIETVTLTDNFFALGGNSISAMLCINRIRNVFGVECSIEDFFMTESTIRDFAKLVVHELKE